MVRNGVSPLPKLTALRVKNAKPGRHGDGEGLYLVVSDTLAKSWVLRVKIKGGIRTDVGLGSASLVSLDEAREQARRLRKAARSGKHPNTVREKERAAIPTFKEAAEATHAGLVSGWSERHGAAFLSTLRLHAFPKIGGLRVDSISEGELLTVLSPLWSTKPAAARKMRQRLGLVLDYAKGMGWRSTGAPRDGLRPMLPKQARGRHFASMPYADVPAFVATVEGEADTMGRLALLLTIYTAARNGEVREAKWSHFDLGAGEWHRPAELMRKTGEAHMVTLSPQALAVLERAKALRTSTADCLVFPGKGGAPLSDMTISKIVRPSGFTVHGFRSSFRTWAAEKMPSIPEAVGEAALSHTIPDKVVKAYNRAKFDDMRRTLVDAWGRYVSGASGQVVQLPLRLGV